jgi:hypothetical protein
MSPKQLQEFEKMKQEIADLKEARSVVFTESIRKRLLDDYIEAGTSTTATTSDVLKAVSEGGAATYNVAKAYDDKVLVEIGGENYYIGVYNI